ncbi:phosphoadenosine phosphosulfate reductase domain-containing protein [Ensifer soli]|uniref:phosphoadenosine phosphosulfate reductase domain-containing protein n=1 Tax=Ciceribacter sp. sgz301302 TaxID=3342379 RepID=UPI0035B7E46E
MPLEPVTPSPCLHALEAEAIHALREVAARFERPVLLFSAGKSGSVLLHLARKAFRPAPLPFPLLHLDTGCGLREMLRFRETVAAGPDVRMTVHPLPDGLGGSAAARATVPGGFDAAIGGDTVEGHAAAPQAEGPDGGRDPARRFERPPPLGAGPFGRGWADPPAPRAGEAVPVRPLGRWATLDLWEYIAREGVAVMPLYLARPRLVVERAGLLLLVDDTHFAVRPGEAVRLRSVRIASLGAAGRTGAIPSTAGDAASLLREIREARHFPQRQDRGGPVP